jgi:hypothetical protein
LLTIFMFSSKIVSQHVNEEIKYEMKCL